MIQDFIATARAGNPLFISDIRKAFVGEKSVKHLCGILLLPDGRRQKGIDVALPPITRARDEFDFACSYAIAEIYNVLTILGGLHLDLYYDLDDEVVSRVVSAVIEAFGADLPPAARGGYGRVINVAERLMNALYPADHADRQSFKMLRHDISEYPGDPDSLALRASPTSLLHDASLNLEGKIICGVDVGGTDIKAALAIDGKLAELKEYDWNPGACENVEEIIDPILIIVRLMRLSASNVDAARDFVSAAMPRDVPFGAMKEAVENGESLAGDHLLGLDGVGICFPDVVVRNKIVGGEVPKTLGMRGNLSRSFEDQFAELTDLDDRLRELCRPGGVVQNTNDGPMAAFTAAVEIAASPDAAQIADGVFAHTLGTDLGTGLILADGSVPEIPLEAYNLIIDLGNFTARSFSPVDVRSLRNTNTGLSGTLQKLTSQAGAFRLAYETLSQSQGGLIKEFEDLGYLQRRSTEDGEVVFVPEEPSDMRKPFLAHLMKLAENDERLAGIFREIGELLAVTCEEIERILGTGLSSRFLFGRFVKARRCFELIAEGAKARDPELRLIAADAGMTFSKLMRELDDTDGYSVAQFGQAVGAIYFANAALL